MQIDPKIFKAYDIRGVYPEELNEENIVPIIQAIYTFFTKEDPTKQLSVVLGHDMRLSSPQLFDAARKTLVEMGAKVIDIGLVSTPSFYFAVFHYGYDTGIQITASHNPKEYNGMKFVKNSPQGLIKIGKSTGMDEIQKMIESGFTPQPQPNGVVEKKENVLDEEVEHALSLSANPQIKKFRIVADPANAMGAQYIDALFRHIPADLIKMNFELDGSFPSHQPNPLEFETLEELQKKVLEEKADFGLAPDGDGDRLFFIDEKGEIVHATIITAIIARELLKKNPGSTILFDIRSIVTPKRIIEELGGKYEITKVGHAYITEQLAKSGGLFAGESSAHYFYKSNGNAESQLMTIVTILKVLTEENIPFSQLVAQMKRSHESGEINFKVHDVQNILGKLKEIFKEGELSTLDGIAISYPHWRFSVRASNTEPLLRLNVEADTHEIMEKKRDALVAIISSQE